MSDSDLIRRREFILRSGLVGAGFLALRFPVWARSIFAFPQHNIPAVKKLDSAWVKSLYLRGKPVEYLKSKNELKYIGMPAGGLHAGTVYLGGDGRLWLWQIFNQTMEGKEEGIVPKEIGWNDGEKERRLRSRDGAAYVEPDLAAGHRVLDQGFAIRIQQNGHDYIMELNEESWGEVSFQPTYPTATIRYTGKDCPVEVSLSVFSPFIPLNAQDSALPATILRVSVKNKTAERIQVSVLGWLENGASKFSAIENTGLRKNEYRQLPGGSAIFSSFEPVNPALRSALDYGTMCLALRHSKAMNQQDGHSPDLNQKQAQGNSLEQEQSHAIIQTYLDPWPVTAACFDKNIRATTLKAAPEKLVGGLVRSEELLTDKTLTADFSISWHFNNVNPGLKKLVKDAQAGYYYGSQFKDAFEVSTYLDQHFNRLTGATESWQETWNDSTLPHWFLDRTFINIGTLATANTYRFADGRFWSWEGVGACPGTCTHVWQYAQAMARIFPELERILRERVDLGTGFIENTGAILFRGEDETSPAIDGQAGTILRFYREHQLSKDRQFLERCWPRIKKAVQFMLAQDKNGDGMTDTPMENTLDAVWEGEISWIVGLCLAAASAAHAMAIEMNDQAFAGVCSSYVASGRQNMEKLLFNGEYFIHRPDSLTGRKKLGSYNTCHIDQVYGQSWAFQTGLPRILDKEKVLSALKALWKYNFTPDVGPYIKTHTGGRPYAVAGEGGMIMNTNPHNEVDAYGENMTWQLGYFHECMSGFEHQVASHLMAEGMVEESLILTRHIHDRYHAAKRNPFNEIECSDHYARAMSSYGSFISACGFEYHGPKGYIAFAPAWNRENFKAAFTAAEGWGSYSQEIKKNQQTHLLQLKYGWLKLNSIRLEKTGNAPVSEVSVTKGSMKIASSFKQTGTSVLVTFNKELQLDADESIEVRILILS